MTRALILNRIDRIVSALEAPDMQMAADGGPYLPDSLYAKFDELHRDLADADQCLLLWDAAWRHALQEARDYATADVFTAETYRDLLRLPDATRAETARIEQRIQISARRAFQREINERKEVAA
jgi:hypothetical protein